MVKIHGRRARVWINGRRLSQDISSVDEQRTAETAQVTTLENADHEYIPGVKGASVSMPGYWDAATDHVDEFMESIMGQAPDDVFLLIRANIQGEIGLSIPTVAEMEYSINGPLNGPVGVTARVQATGRHDRITVLEAYGTVTAAGTTATSLDLGGSPDSMSMNVQCDLLDALPGTAEVIIYSGASNGAETNAHGTFTFTGTAGTALRVTSGVDRHITAVWTLNGLGSAAFVAAVSNEV